MNCFGTPRRGHERQMQKQNNRTSAQKLTNNRRPQTPPKTVQAKEQTSSVIAPKQRRNPTQIYARSHCSNHATTRQRDSKHIPYKRKKNSHTLPTFVPLKHPPELGWLPSVEREGFMQNLNNHAKPEQTAFGMGSRSKEEIRTKQHV